MLNATSSHSLFKPHLVPKPFKFSGDTALLEPFMMNGLTNKEHLTQDEVYFNRPDINEKALLKQLSDNRDTEPVLIAGGGRTGKSTLANRLAKQLKRKGHPVFCIDNIMQPREEYLSSQHLTNLTRDIQQRGTRKRVFLFIDEPHVIPVLEHKYEPDRIRQESKSTLYRLKQFLKKNTHVKLVGVMAPEVLDWTGQNSSKEQQQLLESIFKPSNYINVPKIKDLKPHNIIDMFNNGLAAAKFESMPKEVEQQLLKLRQSLDIRIMFSLITAFLKEDSSRSNNPEKIETISSEIWGGFVHYLPEYLQKHQRD